MIPYFHFTQDSCTAIIRYSKYNYYTPVTVVVFLQSIYLSQMMYFIYWGMLVFRRKDII